MTVLDHKYSVTITSSPCSLISEWSATVSCESIYYKDARSIQVWQAYRIQTVFSLRPVLGLMQWQMTHRPQDIRLQLSEERY